MKTLDDSQLISAPELLTYVTVEARSGRNVLASWRVLCWGDRLRPVVSRDLEYVNEEAQRSVEVTFGAWC